MLPAPRLQAAFTAGQLPDGAIDKMAADVHETALGYRARDGLRGNRPSLLIPASVAPANAVEAVETLLDAAAPAVREQQAQQQAAENVEHDFERRFGSVWQSRRASR